METLRRGTILLENLEAGDLVWDGVDFVPHGGLVEKGYKDVITYSGLTATPDHLVLPLDPGDIWTPLEEAEVRRLEITRHWDVNYGSGYFVGKKFVYDILNCGPRNRFMANGVLVHNCGYQGGPNAITTMDTDKKIPDAEKPGLVKAWRAAHPNIVRFWYKSQDCAIKAIKNPGEKVPLARGAYFIKHKDALLMYLPSGRYLMYPKSEIVEGPYGDQIRFWGLDQNTGKWSRQSTYGGKLVENCLSLNVKILTESGVKLAKDVLPSDKLWDGFNWVSHGGLVLKGIQKTISVNGIRLTPDHKILTDEGWKNASSCQGLNRFKVSPPNSGILCRVRWEKIFMEFQMRLWKYNGFLCKRIYEEKAKILRVPTVQNHIREAEDTRYVETPSLCGLAVNAGQVSSTYSPSVAQLWWPRNISLRSLGFVFREFLERYGGVLQKGANFGA